jgi:hypothetical protein
MPANSPNLIGFRIPPEWAENASPSALADLLVQARQRPYLGDQCHLTDLELRELIYIAFYASLEAEEGRYPQGVTLFSGVTADIHLPWTPFREPELLSVGAVRRLAPAVHPTHALRVISLENRLLIAAFARNAPLGDRLTDGPEFWTLQNGEPGLSITIEGPGELVVSEFMMRASYRAGRIRPTVPSTMSSGIQAAAFQAAAEPIKRLKERTPEADARWGGRGSYAGMLNSLIARTLRRMSDGQHGGTIAILPDCFNSEIQLQWPFLRPMRFGAAAEDYWAGWLERKGSQEINAFRIEMLDAADLVAALTSVDGCVVMTPGFDVLGFGGEIVVSTKASDVPFIDAVSGEPWPDQLGTDLGGMRHRSALRLARALVGSVVLVVSQDGGISVFHSTDAGVTCYRGFHGSL